MKVFKLFFMVMKKYNYQFTMYIGIFCGVLFGGVLPNMDTNTVTQYVNPKVDFAILDNDNTELSRGLVDYLEEKHVRVELPSYDPERFKEDIYSRYICSVVIIEEGFEANLFSKSGESWIKVYDVPDNTSAIAFRDGIEEYMDNLRFEMAKMISKISPTTKAGSVADVLEEVKAKLTTSVEVEFVEEGKVVHDKNYYFYLYIPWIIVLMSMVSLTPVLSRLDEEKLRKRIYASPYKFTRMNAEIYLALITVGILMCVVLFTLSIVFIPERSNVGLYLLNMFVMMLVALSITFFFSKFVKNDMIISAAGNLVGLGMSFMCGVFVPQAVMSPGILAVARFMPVYWYVKALDAINGYRAGDLPSILGFIGVELLFAIALFGGGLYAAKVKRVKN